MSTRRDLDFFRMANVASSATGLPFVLWLSVRYVADDHCFVCASTTSKARPEEMTIVSVEPEVRVVAGYLEDAGLALLRKFMTLNRSTISAHWRGDIDSGDALSAVKAVDGEL